MSSNTYDYIIIGSGASGLQLALAMLRDSYFDDKSIGIIEKRKKFTNDKTWCYWEEGDGLYDSIIHKSWDKGYFKACDETINLNLQSYRYKMIKSIDFYIYSKEQIESSLNIEFIEDDIIEVIEKENIVEVNGRHLNYRSKHVFDSRLPLNYKPEKSINILQHFKGWFIETEKEVFDPEQFCMMDYSLSDPGKTCFTYILPFSKTKALVEFTYFSPNLVDEKTYEKYIESYLVKKLNLKKYSIYDTEKGVIPMTSHPFYKKHSMNITKIGTAGGWVKASTGYSFKNSERNALKILDNIKTGKKPHFRLYNKRFKHYDKLFLDVLYNHNDYGERLFYKMYRYNNITRIFRFLDEESKLDEELKIIFSMTSPHFIRALIKHAAQGFKIK